MSKLWNVLVVSVCVGSLLVMGWVQSAIAQAQDEDEALSLTLNETIEGTLSSEETIRFRIEGDLSLTQDIVVVYEADGVVLSGRTIMTEQFPVQTTQTVIPSGGGGDDNPVMGMFVIPAYHVPIGMTPPLENITRTGELVLTRPLAGEVTFSLTAYAIDPVRLDIDLGGRLTTSVSPENPIQVFVFDAEITIPFDLEIIDMDGVSIQIDNLPERSATMGLDTFRFVDLFVGEFIGSYPQRDDPELAGVTSATLYYFGETTFRLVIRADGPYTLTYIPPQPAS